VLGIVIKSMHRYALTAVPTN